MITGFNTDVKYEGHVYHVQSEDCGKDNPVLESLVYVGGTIVAKKRTPYRDQLVKGADEQAIAALLKKQHQVIIAAIKAGRIEELISHTQKQQDGSSVHRKRGTGGLERQNVRNASVSPRQSPPDHAESPTPLQSVANPRSSSSQPSSRESVKGSSATSFRRGDTGGLNLDSVIADYLKRSSGQVRLDVKVLTPEAFTAGKSIGLRVQVTRESRPEFDAIVTVKIIGTAFKPQVFIGRVGGDGVAAFSVALPAFNTGTAAIVIEAQSGGGRGELKKLIKRA